MCCLDHLGLFVEAHSCFSQVLPEIAIYQAYRGEVLDAAEFEVFELTEE